MRCPTNEHIEAHALFHPPTRAVLPTHSSRITCKAIRHEHVATNPYHNPQKQHLQRETISMQSAEGLN